MAWKSFYGMNDPSEPNGPAQPGNANPGGFGMYNSALQAGAPGSSTYGFGNPSNPQSVFNAPLRYGDFYNSKIGKAGPVQQQPYVDMENMLGSRSQTLWNQAQGEQPNLSYVPGSMDQWYSLGGGAVPTLGTLPNAPTSADAAPWMNNLMSGERQQAQDLVSRMAGAGIQRGGMGVAGGIPLDAAGQLNAVKGLTSQYGQNFQNSMGYANTAANFNRQNVMDQYNAAMQGWNAKQKQIMDYYGLRNQQAAQQLSKYGTDLGQASSYGGQQLSALNSGMGNAMQLYGAKQGAWDKDVGYDNTMRMYGLEHGWGSGPTQNGPMIPGGNAVYPNAAQSAIGNLALSKYLQQLQYPNGTPEQQAQQQAQYRALQDYQEQQGKQQELQQYLAGFKNGDPDVVSRDSDPNAQNHHWNQTPYDLYMGTIGGYAQYLKSPQFGYSTSSSTAQQGPTLSLGAAR